MGTIDDVAGELSSYGEGWGMGKWWENGVVFFHSRVPAVIQESGMNAETMIGGYSVFI